MTYLSTDQNHLPGASGHHFCCTLHVHVMYIKMNYTQCHLVQVTKDIPDFQKTILHALHSQPSMMFLKGMFINISSVECLQEVLEGKSYMYPPTVILLPLCSVSLTRKNSQRCRIIDSLRPLGCNDQSI